MPRAPFRHVLVTGASSGLGRGLALHYARAGATVHAAARRAEELRELAAEPAAGGRIVPVPLDATDLEALTAAVRAAEAAAGGALDLVVANAGIGWPTPGWRLEAAEVHRILELNATAACATVSLALPAMVARGRGTVAAVASLAGFSPMAQSAAYVASKAAVQAFLDCLRIDLQGTGVRVCTVNPGYVRTPLVAHAKGKLPMLLEVDEAVGIITRGLDRGRPVLSFPVPMHLGIRLLGALPRALRDRLLRPRRRRRGV